MIEFLENLPSRGALQSNTGSLLGRNAVNYVCNHDTDPPGNQISQSSELDILATCLQKAKQKEVEAKKKQKAEKAGGQSSKQGNKRKDESLPSTSGPAKRQSTENKTYTAQQLRSKQNQELAEICRSLAVPVSGKKDTLVQRILKAQDSRKSR